MAKNDNERDRRRRDGGGLKGKTGAKGPKQPKTSGEEDIIDFDLTGRIPGKGVKEVSPRS